ncbi:hypothetical protein Tco_0394375 [Tanacetum coccineum]
MHPNRGGLIDAIDADEEITLVSVHDMNVSAGEEVAEECAGDIVSAASAATTVSAATTTTATINTIDDITLAQALEEMKSTKPKKKGIVIQELGESTTKISLQLPSRQSQDKGKRLDANLSMAERMQATRTRWTLSIKKRLQAQEQEELSDAEKATLFQQLLEKTRKHPRDNAKKQKVEDDKEIAELKQCLEIIPDEEKIHKEGRKSYYQIMRADGKSQMYMIFSHMLKSYNREDLEDLYKLVKAKYNSTRPVEDLDLLLWGDLKTMFEPHVEDIVWRNQQDYKVLDWKMYDSCGVHSLRMQHVHIHMLVEKKYPLIPSTLSMMLEKKLQIDYESEMSYQLLKFIMKQLKK